MLPTILTPDLADPAWTTDAVGAKVATEVVNGGLPAVVVGAAVVAGLELLGFEIGTVVVEIGVVVVNDPGITVLGAAVPGMTVLGATVPGITVIPDIPDTVIEPPTAKPAVAQPHTEDAPSMTAWYDAEGHPVATQPSMAAYSFASEMHWQVKSRAPQPMVGAPLRKHD